MKALSGGIGRALFGRFRGSGGKKLKDPTELGQKRTDSRFPLFFTVFFTFGLMFLQFERAFHGLDNAWTDRLFLWRGMEAGDSRIVVVEIDDASLKKIGSFPLRRRVYAQLIEKLYVMGAKVVALDVIFPDPSPSDEDDRLLVEATRKAGKKLIHSVIVDGSTINQNVFVFPFEPLQKASANHGIVLQPFQDRDGSVRRTPLVIGEHPVDEFSWAKDPKRIPTLGLQALSVFTGKDPQHFLDSAGPALRLNFRGQREKIVGRQRVGDEIREITLVEHGIKRVPIWEVLGEDLDEAKRKLFDGAIILVGSTAVGYFDHYPNPFTEMMPGVIVHATLIDNLMHDRFLRPVPFWLPFLLIPLFALLSHMTQRLGPLQASLVVLGLAGGWAAATFVLFVNLVEARFTTPLLALLGPFVVLTVHKVMIEQQAKREVRSMFGQYVAPEIVDIIVKDPSALKLGGQYRDMTMFFLDIAHFTTISEKMPPENLIQFLNHYLTALSDNVHKHKGVIDKYIGDCIMAFWNAPLEVQGHRVLGCKAAIDCIATMERLNKDYVDPTMPEKPAVRIGLNSGQVTVGNTGSARKLAYTVLGDEVNLASRLEGANKFFGSTVMASENTYEEAKDQVVGRILGSVRVVGKEIPIKVFELLAHKGQESKAWADALPAYHEGVERFLAGKFEEAKKDFARVLELVPGDKPAKLYQSACEDYIVIPPQNDLYKVFNLTSK